LLAYGITATRIIYNIFSRLVADIISTVEFDHTGDYLATGDKGGRVVLFERNESVRSESYQQDQSRSPFAKRECNGLQHFLGVNRKRDASTSSTQR